MDVNRDAIEQLAIAQAMYKYLGERLSTKDPHNLRGQADTEIMADYAQGKKSTILLTVDGREVGKVVPYEVAEHSRLVIEDESKMLQWFAENPEEAELAFHAVAWKVANWYAENRLKQTGEIPNGCYVYVEPKRLDGTRISVDVKKVTETLGMTLPQAYVHLLEGTVE